MGASWCRGGDHAGDRAVLAAFYDATGGPGWRISTNWKTEAPLRDWHGVTTDADGRVSELTLDSNDLSGPVPARLGDLTSLEVLDLSWNDLSGPIPAALGRLENLWWLNLGGNALTGPVPAWLGDLTSLRLLQLGWNDLSGPIPAALGRLENLEQLDLLGNALTGPVPARLGDLTSLGGLDLRWNDLSGPIPAELGRLENLGWLGLGGNALTGPVPAWLGDLTSLYRIDLRANNLSGPIPAALGRLENLFGLDLSYNWGLSGPLPAGLEESALEELDFFVTQTCAPNAWKEWLATVEFYGPLCDAGPDVTIDVAVVYTPAALEAAGGAAAIEAEIDLMIAETNEAYAASGVGQRLALVARSEVPYTETNGGQDIDRLADPSDGHLDEIHALRDGAGADLVHLIVGETDDSFYSVCGIAELPGAFGITLRDCGGITFAHELGHNMGLRHDRFQVELREGSVSSHPAYGYANQRVFAAGAPQSARWVTIMSYLGHCRLAGVTCSTLPRFSNPHQHHGGDPLGIPFGTGLGLTGASDAATVLEAMGPAVAAWRDRPTDAANRPPMAVGRLPDRRLASVGSELDVDVSLAFMDPDGDALFYTVWSSAPWLVKAAAAGGRVTLTAVAEGAATIRVAATDAGGLSVSQSFSATVEGAAGTDPPGSVESDRAALEALYDATGGSGWTDSTNWKTGAPLGEWYGVTTDADGRVAEVDLYDNALAGWLPPALGSLTHLETLRLGWNDLTGPLPAALGNLANLVWLDLGETRFTGPIPGALGRLVNLRELNLSSNFFQSNHLSGPLPAALGNLVNLVWLDLSRNDLTGPVPAWLGDLPRLRSLSLGGNELTGRIPGALGGMANLVWLDLGGNDLTGPIPAALGSLASLEALFLGGNELTGRIPAALGSLTNLRRLDLSRSDLTGVVPSELGSLTNLEYLDLSYTWGLSGPLPAGLEQSSLEELDIFVTQTCAPAAWQEWLATLEFLGPLCGAGPDVTIDVAVVYTPTAREAAGGTAGIEAAIDVMVAETNQAYAASGVHQRVVLTGREEVPDIETFSLRDLYELADPSDGRLDEAHALRDRTGADMVHLIVGDPYYDVCGIAFLPGLGWPGPFGVTLLQCGGIVFAHELGHNMGLLHDRFRVQVAEDGVLSHPAYGYVNQRVFRGGAPASSQWATIMAYEWFQCGLADARCSSVPRFSNPHQHYGGDPLGVAFGVGSGVTGAADATAVLNATGPAMAALLDRPDRPNRAPVAVGTLPDRSLTPAGTLDVDVSEAFDDPDGDPLSYTVSSSSPAVVAVQSLGPRVTLTAVSEGMAAVQVRASDPGGLSATQTFTVTVERANRPPVVVGTLPAVVLPEPGATLAVDVSEAFDDPDGDPLSYTVSSSSPAVVAVQSLGSRVTLTAVALGRAVIEVRATDPDDLSATQSFRVRVTAPFTDDPIVPGMTPVKAVHFTELRTRIDVLRREVGLARFGWTDPVLRAGVTQVKLAHLLELREALAAAYAEAGRAVPRWTDAAAVGGTTPIRAVHVTELRAAVVALELE